MAIVDFFLCHSSDDQDAIVRPVYEVLLRLGRTAWLDKVELTVGDSLTNEIQCALSQCAFVVVFLSKSFLFKAWPQQELSASLNLQIFTQEKRVLPIVIDIPHCDLSISLPFIADKLYLRWQGNPEVTAQDLISAWNKATNKSGTHNGRSVPPVDKAGLAALLELTYIILRCDQIRTNDPGIPEVSTKLPSFEGGWGKSTIGVLKPLFGVAPSDLVKWQGGITTCVLVGNALTRFERSYFQYKNVRAIAYLNLLRTALLKAQHVNGGFGALVQTRDSIEPHSTHRHTAATLSFLQDAGAPREVTKRAVDYLLGFLAIVEAGDPINELALP